MCPIDGLSGLAAELDEDQLRRVTLGGLEVLNGPIALADYHPEWPEHFAREAERIRAALADRALLIEHVGSTSDRKSVV